MTASRGSAPGNVRLAMLQSVSPARTTTLDSAATGMRAETVPRCHVPSPAPWTGSLCAPSATPAALRYPEPATLRALDEQVELGYLRGIRTQLDTLATADPAHAEFVDVMRRLAGQFQFDAMRAILRAGLEEPPDA